MTKKQVKLDENSLKNLIRESIIKYLDENVDEISPEFLIHSAHKAVDDKKNYPGRGKNSTDPAMRAKRDRQAKAFGDEAADRINQELGDDTFHVKGDRGARTMNYSSDGKSAFLRPDIEDLGATKLYADDYVEGDEPMTLSSLEPDEFSRVQGMFDKFRGYHDRAKELDDKYLEERITDVISNVIKEYKEK